MEVIMPGFNQRGPMGEGPLTGRKMGRCTNFGAGRINETPAETAAELNDSEPLNPRSLPGSRPGFGYGRGRGGAGRGMGRQNRFRGGF